MGRTWDINEGKVIEGGHKWKYSHVHESEEHVSVVFRCANGCPTTVSRPLEHPEKDSGECWIPPNTPEVQLRRMFSDLERANHDD